MASSAEWAAGFYEGEGSCIVSKKGCLQVAAYQSGNPWPLDQLQRLFGGTVKQYKLRKPTNGPVPRKPHAQWTIYGSAALSFLEAVVPYLSPAKVEKVNRSVAAYVRGRDRKANGNGNGQR